MPVVLDLRNTWRLHLGPHWALPDTDESSAPLPGVTDVPLSSITKINVKEAAAISRQEEENTEGKKKIRVNWDRTLTEWSTMGTSDCSTFATLNLMFGTLDMLQICLWDFWPSKFYDKLILVLETKPTCPLRQWWQQAIVSGKWYWHPWQELEEKLHEEWSSDTNSLGYWSCQAPKRETT